MAVLPASLDPSCPQRALALLNALTEFSCQWLLLLWCHLPLGTTLSCPEHCMHGPTAQHISSWCPLWITLSPVLSHQDCLSLSIFQHFRERCLFYLLPMLFPTEPHTEFNGAAPNKTKWQAQCAQNHSSLPQADAVLQGSLAISCSFLKASLSQEIQPPMLWTADWMLVSPLNPCVESLPPQCDGVRRWGLWEVIQSWGWSPCEWN